MVYARLQRNSISFIVSTLQFAIFFYFHYSIMQHIAVLLLFLLKLRAFLNQVLCMFVSLDYIWVCPMTRGIFFRCRKSCQDSASNLLSVSENMEYVNEWLYCKYSLEQEDSDCQNFTYRKCDAILYRKYHAFFFLNI